MQYEKTIGAESIMLNVYPVDVNVWQFYYRVKFKQFIYGSNNKFIGSCFATEQLAIEFALRQLKTDAVIHHWDEDPLWVEFFSTFTEDKPVKNNFILWVVLKILLRY